MLAKLRAQRLASSSGAAPSSTPALPLPDTPQACFRWRLSVSSSHSSPVLQLTGSAALLARMRKSRAVTGEAAAPAAAPPAAAPSAPPAAGGWDGRLTVLHGGEAASQVASDVAAEARRRGFEPQQLASMADFRQLRLDRQPLLMTDLLKCSLVWPWRTQSNTSTNSV